jgi:hypothetical protein
MTLLPSDLDVERQLIDARIAVMEATLHIRSPRRSTRYRTTRNLIIAGAAVAALTAGAIVVAQVTAEQRAHSVTCYEEASLDSRTLVVWGVSDLPSDTLDPVAGCAFIWRDGFDADPTDPNAGTGTNPVPDLVVCELPDGSAGVLPREDGPPGDTDFCAALGLADWDSD